MDRLGWFIVLLVILYRIGDSEAVIDVLDSDPRLSMLRSLVRKAGLEQQLDQSRTFTMFAPVNDAFKLLPPSDLDELDNDREKLAAVLLFHVLPNTLMRTQQFNNDDLVQTAHPKGRMLRTNVYQLADNETVVTINGAKILEGNRVSGNAIIHLTNRFFCPVPDQSIAEMTESCDTLRGFRAILFRANRFEELRSATGPMTVFAPTPEAFSKLDTDTMRHVMENETVLQELVGFHVMQGVYVSEGVLDKQWVSMVLGRGMQVQLYVTTDGYTKRLAGVNTARVLKADIIATNGVIHLIDEVLLPRSGIETCGVF